MIYSGNMRIAALTLLAAAAACGQSESQEPWKSKGLADVKMVPLPKVPHIHTVLLECKGAADGIYARQDRVYFACLRGKEVCSEEKGKITKSMIEAWDASRAAAKKRGEEVKAAVERALESNRQSGRAETRGSGGARSTVITLDTPAAGSDAAPPPPVEDERVKELAIGTPRAEVVQKLGEPYLKISGQVEYYSYRLKSGGTAELEFADGKLKKVRTEAGQ